LFTSLTRGGKDLELTDVGISSLMDTWLLVRETEANGERGRVLQVIKSRGMAHSSQIQGFLLTDQGVRLGDASPGRAGAQRLSREAPEKTEPKPRIRRQA